MQNTCKIQDIVITNEKALEMCSEKLFAIADKVTAADRKAAIAELDINPSTINRYLRKKQVRKLDTGIKLFDFLNKRINERLNTLTT